MVEDTRLFYVLFDVVRPQRSQRKAVIVRSYSTADAQEQVENTFEKATNVYVRKLPTEAGKPGIVEGLPV